MANELHAWLADADGFYAGEIDSYGTDMSWEDYVAAAAANGQTAIDKKKARPANRPIPANPLTAKYAAADSDSKKLDVLAERLGVKEG